MSVEGEALRRVYPDSMGHIADFRTQQGDDPGRRWRTIADEQVARPLKDAVHGTVKPGSVDLRTDRDTSKSTDRRTPILSIQL